MSKAKKKRLTPSRTAAVVTAIVLGLCGVGNLLLFVLTVYVPLLLAGILQLMPAVLNLLLLLPVGKKSPKADGAIAQAEEMTKAEDASNIEEAIETEEAPPAKKKKWPLRALRALRSLPRKCITGLAHLWNDSHNKLLPALLALAVLGFNIYFWVSAKGGAAPYVAEYYIPVILVVLFVLFIVLDKWCKHASGDPSPAEGEEDHEHPKDADKTYDRALLHSLRGALAAGRWSYLIMTVALMIRLLGFVELSTPVIVIISLLFVYETVFLLMSLAVRVIRHEMETAPELSIPMPGLGGGDLGILSYLEKNTGITMRSLWSIRLVKYVLPYAAMSVVLLLWGFSGLVKIEAHQQGAHYRLGVLQEETLEPGLHMTLPWPFDSVEVYDTEVANTMTIGYISSESTDNIWTQAHGTEEYKLLLGNGNELVSINLRLVYRIDDLKAYLSNNASPETLMQATAYNIVTDKTIRTDLTTLLSADRTVLANDIKAELMDRMELYRTGITVVDVVLESIHPPVDIADVYQQMVSANAEAERIIVQAYGTASIIREEANRRKDEIESAAKVEKTTKIADAHLETAEFKAIVAAKAAWEEENKETGSEFTYEYFRYLQTIAAAYGQGDCQVIIIGDGVNSSNIYIGNVSLGGN